MITRRRLEVIIGAIVLFTFLSKMYYIYISQKPLIIIRATNQQIDTLRVDSHNVNVLSLDSLVNSSTIDRNVMTMIQNGVNVAENMSNFRLFTSLASKPLFNNSVPIFIQPDPGLIALRNKIATRKILSIFKKTIKSENSKDVLVSDIPNFVHKTPKDSPPKKPFCPGVPPNLLGEIAVNFTLSDGVTMAVVEKLHPDITNGGEWSPPDCTANSRVAIIVPFRDRKHHLEIMMYHMIPMFKRQQISFNIFVVEQYGHEAFNKGRLMNVGFLEASKVNDYQCFIFHDVDMVSLNDRNMHTCPDSPRHMSVLVDELSNDYPMYGMVGGVFSIRTDHFRLVNGYSNRYWGWGAEDDDMGLRIQQRGMRILRPSSFIAKYTMIPHEKRHSISVNKMYKNLRNQRGFRDEGINSLNYKIMSHLVYPLYTHFIVDIKDQ